MHVATPIQLSTRKKSDLNDKDEDDNDTTIKWYNKYV